MLVTSLACTCRSPLSAGRPPLHPLQLLHQLDGEEALAHVDKMHAEAEAGQVGGWMGGWLQPGGGAGGGPGEVEGHGSASPCHGFTKGGQVLA